MVCQYVEGEEEGEVVEEEEKRKKRQKKEKELLLGKNPHQRDIREHHEQNMESCS